MLRTAREPATVAGAPRDSAVNRDGSPAFETSRSYRGFGETRRFQMNLALLFAMTTLVLTSVGLYSALSSATRCRTREIAIRTALGAKPAAFAGWCWCRVSRLSPQAWGQVSVVASNLSPGLLFGISPSDPGVCATASVLERCPRRRLSAKSPSAPGESDRCHAFRMTATPDFESGTHDLATAVARRPPLPRDKKDPTPV
jgi:hypothetical protein